MSAIKIADQAATEAFDAYLRHNRSTATSYVPESVIDAARRAYAEAGGKRAIVVVGHGNVTHPVCSVSVRVKTRKDS